MSGENEEKIEVDLSNAYCEEEADKCAEPEIQAQKDDDLRKGSMDSDVEMIEKKIPQQIARSPTFVFKSLKEIEPKRYLDWVPLWMFVCYCLWAFSMIFAGFFAPFNQDVQNPEQWKFFLVPISIQVGAFIAYFIKPLNLGIGIFSRERNKALNNVFLMNWLLALILGKFRDANEIASWEKIIDSVNFKNVYEFSSLNYSLQLNPQRKLNITFSKLMEIRYYNRQLANPFFSSMFFIMAEINALILSCGWLMNIDAKKYCFSKAKKRTKRDLSLLYDGTSENAKRKLTVGVKEQFLTIFIGCFILVCLFCLLVEFTPRTDKGKINELKTIKQFYVSASGGPFVSFMFKFLDFKLRFIVAFFHLIFPGICLAIGYVTIYSEMNYINEMIHLFEQFLFSIFSEKTFIDEKELEVFPDPDIVEDCRKDPGLWVELRYSIRKYFIEVLLKRLQWGVSIWFLLAFSLLTYVGVVMITTGTLGFSVSGPWTIVLSPILIFTGFKMMFKLADAHNLHEIQISSAIIWLKNILLGETKHSEIKETDIHSFINLLQVLQTIEYPFQLFYVPITKNLARTLNGYLLSVLTFIISFLFDKYF